MNYNSKEYNIDEEGNWSGINKNGDVYKVSSEKLIAALNIQYEKENALPVKGLGDIVSKITQTLGIEECEGCKERKKLFNSIFNWLRATRELTDDEKTFVNDLASRKKMDSDERNRLFSLYNVITKSNVSICNCPGLVSQLIARLQGFID